MNFLKKDHQKLRNLILNIMKYSEKNNFYHTLRKWYHIDFSQKSPEIPIIVRWVQKFYLICIFREENF